MIALAKPALAPSAGLPAQPYPGLRPFEPDEHRIFFGREEMVDTVIDGLATKNLVVVHGASGSGKSSLVRAGVLPWLAIQQSIRRNWLTGIRRPAGGPLRNLAGALAELLGAPPGSDEASDAAWSWHIRLALGTAVLSDIEAALSARGASLCLLIDQFEELFRHAKHNGREEAELLIQLLCSVAGEKNPSPHLFIILTMRSDYLGECARFEGFAETVNACQYLLPRLDDFGILRAIHEPATLYGGTIDAAVGDRLLFTARREEDALPVVQHALMRACAYARQRHGSGEGWTVTLADLQAIEGKDGALSRHADEVLAEIQAADPIHLKTAEWLFRSLTELEGEGRIIRRPQNIAQLIGVAGDVRSSVFAVIEAFRSPGCNFLMTDVSGPLTEGTEVDIGHEALIRRWRRLSDPTRDPLRSEPVGWVLREFEDGLRWRSLAVLSRVFDRDKSATLSPATTEAYLSWWPEHSSAWAARYALDKDSALEEYQHVEQLWHASKKALEAAQRRARVRARLNTAVIGGLVLLVVLLTGLINSAYIKEQYYWRVLMGPSLLKREEEKQIAANPGLDFKECATGCPSMVVVPAGTFWMGSLQTERYHKKDESPRHEVTIAKPFAVGKTEVTFEQWDICVAAGACPEASDNHHWGRENRPVINVSWDEAKQYVAWLSRITGNQYRLLSEAEWEYAARAGTLTPYFWGEELGDRNANCDACNSGWSEKTAPVASFRANPFGLYDMHGNVGEWVEDVYHDSYQGAPPDGSPWVKDGDPDTRVHRNGSWRNDARRLRSAYRNYDPPFHRYDNLGFRIARTLNP